MTFRSYFCALSPDDKAAFAERAGTSIQYVQLHLMARPPRKVPRPDLMYQLAEATQGACSLQEVLAHFYAVA